MKKIRLLLLVVTIIFSTLVLSSCKKNLKYEICGLYIELEDVEKPSIDDDNPKIYFKKNDNNILSRKVGQLGKRVYFTDVAKVVDEELGKFTFIANLSIPKEAFENIEIRAIIYKNGEYVVENKVHKTIKTAGNCLYSKKYIYDDKEYQVQFQLIIETRE